VRELKLLGRRGCHLCDDLAEALAPLLAGRAIALVHQDVDADPVLVRRYGHHVPVLLADGAVLCAHRLDRERVAAALAGQPWEPLELN
jgi:hypothetical protein